MNVRKGFRRLWIALAGLWLAVGLLATVLSREVEMAWFAVLPAVAIAGLGLVAEWVIQGFQDA
jgi:hypothetical protein